MMHILVPVFSWYGCNKKRARKSACCDSEGVVFKTLMIPSSYPLKVLSERDLSLECPVCKTIFKELHRSVYRSSQYSRITWFDLFTIVSNADIASVQHVWNNGFNVVGVDGWQTRTIQCRPHSISETSRGYHYHLQSCQLWWNMSDQCCSPVQLVRAQLASKNHSRSSPSVRFQTP
jgi:hypothetical protein